MDNPCGVNYIAESLLNVIPASNSTSDNRQRSNGAPDYGATYYAQRSNHLHSAPDNDTACEVDNSSNGYQSLRAPDNGSTYETDNNNGCQSPRAPDNGSTYETDNNNGCQSPRAPDNGPTHEADNNNRCQSLRAPDNGSTYETDNNNGCQSPRAPDNGPTHEADNNNGCQSPRAPDNGPTHEADNNNRCQSLRAPDNGPTLEADNNNRCQSLRAPDNGPTHEAELPAINTANDYRPKFRVQHTKMHCAASAQKASEMASSITLPMSFANVPLNALQQSTMAIICDYFDRDTDACNDEHVRQNWEGLAEYMNLDPEVINYIAAYRESKTLSSLQVWSKASSRTIGELYNLIGRLGIPGDMLAWERINLRIRSDALEYLQSGTAPSDPLEESIGSNPNILIDAEEAVKLRRDERVDEFDVIVVQDTHRRQGEERAKFDAYVSFSEKDMPFVKEVIKFLEEENNCKLCLKERDLLPGASTYDSVANLIAERCSKMIVVMSPEYQSSVACDYQSKIALAMNCPQIVIIYKDCPLPPALKIMSLLRYGDLRADWFWNRIQMAIKGEPEALLETNCTPSRREKQFFGRQIKNVLNHIGFHKKKHKRKPEKQRHNDT